MQAVAFLMVMLLFMVECFHVFRLAGKDSEEHSLDGGAVVGPEETYYRVGGGGHIEEMHTFGGR